MASFGNYPPQYLVFNAQSSKQLAIVMKIEGVDELFGVNDVFQTVRYGDPGLVYGLPGLVYGGLRKVGGPNGVGGIKPYIILDQGMLIQQRIEPEQGKGNIGTLSMNLIDKNGEVSFIIAPGNVVDEIMTSKQVTIYLGFQQTSYPEDYLIAYRGYITNLQCPPSNVRFQISDATMKARQPIFSTPTTALSAPINSSVTTIPVLNTAGFYAHILGPDGTYDPIVHTYIIVDSEWMSYDNTGIASPTSFLVTRGALGTLVDAHDVDAQVTNAIYLGVPEAAQGVNFITLALKLLLSGWNGPCETGIALQCIGFVDPLIVSNSFTLLTDDADLDLGLTIGDTFTLSGATNGGNDVTGLITGFQNLNSFTRVILTDQTFTTELTTPAVASFRSKYDTLPVIAGSGCRMRDVDVSTLESIRSNYFTSGIFDVAVYYDAPVFAKDAIADDLFLPMGCYQISRYGRISGSVTKPPLPGIGKLVRLNHTNVIDPDKIVVNRSTNNRCWYDQISYEFDYNPVTQTFGSIDYFVDTVSLSKFNQVLTLPISAKALHSVLGGGSVASQRGQALLSRYKNVALIIELTVNWSIGSLIEVSDICLLVDNGDLKIMNFDTGIRNLGSQLFEVIDRSYNVTQGNVKLKLLSGLGFSANARFGMVSPSTILDTSTTTTLKLTPSYGQVDITHEIAKWTPFIGLPIVVHSPDYSVTGTSTLTGIDLADPSSLDIDPPLGFTPAAGYILEIANYPTDTNPLTNSQYKALYCYQTPSVDLVSGISTTQFTVAHADIGKFIVGNLMILRKSDWSIYSQEVTVTVANTGTDTVTVSAILKNQFEVPFTPDNTFVAEGLGFEDSGGYYRYD